MSHTTNKLSHTKAYPHTATPSPNIHTLRFFITSYEWSAISVALLDSQLSSQCLLYASPNWLLIPRSDCEGFCRTVLLHLKWHFDVKTIRRSGFTGGSGIPSVVLSIFILIYLSLSEASFYLVKVVLWLSIFITMNCRQLYSPLETLLLAGWC